MDKNPILKKYWILLVASIPFLILAIFYFYTKGAREDLSSMRYPRKMYPVGIDSTNLGANKYKTDSTYYTIKDFDFVNQYNQSISKKTLNDKIIVANFFKLQCTDGCNIISEQLARVQSKMIRDDKIIILSFSTDQLNDTIPELKLYADKFGAIPGKWHFLRGKENQILQIAKSEFKLEEIEVETSKKLILIDPDWNIRGYYDGTSENKVNILMGDILLLLNEYKR